MRGIAGRLLLAAFATTLLLLALEAALAFLLPRPRPAGTGYERHHPLFGWENRPDAPGAPAATRGTHNSRGLRSPREIPFEKPPGVTRVLLLGDSFFWGYGVDNESVISAALQRIVPPRVEILNGACSGYGTDQELLWLREEGLRYRPDFVVVGIFPGNDWEDISTPVRHGRAKPYFRREGRRLVLQGVPVPAPGEPSLPTSQESVMRRARLWNLVRERSHLYRFVVGRLQATPRLGVWMRRRGLYDPAADEAVGAAVAVLPEPEIQPLFEALLWEIFAVARDAGAQTLFVFIPMKENTPGGKTRYRGVRPGADRLNDEASRYLGSVTALNRYPYLDLLPLVRSRQAQGEVIYNPGPDDHHWTLRGHRVAAEAVAAWLAARTAGAAAALDATAR